MLFSFVFEFADKSSFSMENVLKVEYMDTLGEDIVVEGDQLLSHKYPTGKTLHLYSENMTYTVSKSIASISVYKVS